MTPKKLLPPDINPGIQQVVLWLWSLDLNTTDSGDGKTHAHECDAPYPYVHMILQGSLKTAADTLRNDLKWLGIELVPTAKGLDGGLPCMQLTYDPADEIAILSLFNVDDERLLRSGRHRAFPIPTAEEPTP